MKKYGRWLVARNSNTPLRSVEIVGSCDIDEHSSETTSYMLQIASIVIEEAQKFKGIPYVNANQYGASKGKITVNFTLMFPEEAALIEFIDSLRNLLDLLEELMN